MSASLHMCGRDNTRSKREEEGVRYATEDAGNRSRRGEHVYGLNEFSIADSWVHVGSSGAVNPAALQRPDKTCELINICTLHLHKVDPKRLPHT